MNDLAQVSTGPRSLGEALSVSDLLRHKAMIADVLKQVMEKDTHYGASFPGDKKQNLLKPGADALLVAFQLVPTFTVEERQFDGNHREYRITCTIKTRSGQVVAEGLGTCSTMETKYRYRNAKPECPKCQQQALMRSKFSPGWYCNTKAGGCGANIDDGAVKGGGGKVENPDIADCWNTCLKIGKKRAQVDATITATGCSDMFTQDVEDMTEKANAEESKHAAPATTAPATPDDRSPAAGNATVEARPTVATAPAATPLSDAGNVGKQACDEMVTKLRELVGDDLALAVWKSPEPVTWPTRHALLAQAVRAIEKIDAVMGRGAHALIGHTLKSAGWVGASTEKPAVRAAVAALVRTAETGETPPPTATADEAIAP